MLSLQSPLLQYSLNSCHIFAVDGADAVVEVQVAQRKTLARVAARMAHRISSEDGLVVSLVATSCVVCIFEVKKKKVPRISHLFIV